MANLSESERLRGWLLYNRLLEQMEQNVPISIPNVGPDPVPMGKLYFKRSEVFERIVSKMRDMAPDGVSSQHQFVEILEQAINTINDELKRQYSPDEMADIVLSINDVERELMFTPYQSLNLNESRIGMGHDYSWKEDLMKIIQDRIKKHGRPGMNREDMIEVLSSVNKEIDEALGMIYNALRFANPESFFKENDL